MRLNLTSLAAAVVLAAFCLNRNVCESAQSVASPPAAGTKSPAKESPRPTNKAPVIPFRGTIKSCSASAGTITVGSRTFNCTRETKIYREGKTAALADSRVGEYVTGSYRKAGDGKLMASSVYLGGKNPSAAQGKASGKSPRSNSTRSKTEEVDE